MSPCFSLGFPGEKRGTIDVRVEEAEDGTLVISDAGDWDRSIGLSFDLT